MKQVEMQPIGVVRIDGDSTRIELDPRYAPALLELDGFSHLNVFWYFDGFDEPQFRSLLQTPKPYKNSPDVIGVFATRSPMRPNPIALTTSQILGIDHQSAVIEISFTDARDGTPVLDLKPYTPSFDRVESPVVPDWCAHWPKSLEESGEFPWENEFHFTE